MAEKYFSGSGEKAGLEIWRIEKLHPTRIPKETYGSFFSGDSYIVLHTTITKDGAYEWHIHFWLGENSSKDEQGAAAIMTVELDDFLGGGPVQHREVQGAESPLFLSYFKSAGGIKIMDGGIASAFNHVEPDKYTPRLLHVKGKRTVRVNQVELSIKSLNDGDVFILDAGLTLYQWNGSKANKYEKFKGLEMVSQIKDNERGGKPEIVVLESGLNDKKEGEAFFKFLGGSGPIAPGDDASDDDVKVAPPQLFKVSDSTGKLVVEKIAEGSLDRAALDENDVFVVDASSEIFVWVGKKATKQEKTSAMQYAIDYLTKNKRPTSTPITRIVQNAETSVFKSLFKVWDAPKKIEFGRAKEKAEKFESKKTDVSALYKKEKQAEEDQKLDDGNGKTTIWRVEKLEPVPVPKEQYGEFYSGDSYIVLYEYEVKGKEFQILYFWQGKDSSTDEKSASALLTVKMDDEMTKAGKNPTQVRVVMNKEPNHFYSIFKGAFVVHTGGIASGFKSTTEKDSYDTDGVSLYHVKGSNAFNTRAIQVEEKAINLNSGDSFVLLTPAKMFIWYGSGASADEKKAAKKIADKLKGKRSIVETDEGVEPAEFWTFLGGKAEYPTSKVLAGGSHDVRLFQGSNKSGSFQLEEIFNFAQEDLTNDDVFILDTFDEVWVWVGNEANETEKTEAFSAALDYVKKVADGRSPDTPVLKVDCGNEPPLFTSHFFGWDYTKTGQDPYLEKLKGLKGGAAVIKDLSEISQYADPKTTKYSYADLKAKKAPKADPKRKHEYLKDDEFKTVLGVTPAEFAKLPAWKQKNIREKAGLF